MVGWRGDPGASRLGARRTALFVLGALSMGPVWSCAGSSTRGGSASGPVSEGDFVQKVADTICGSIGGCCRAAGIPYDAEGCEAFVLAELELEAPPNTTWDSVAAGRCIDWFAGIASSCDEGSAEQEDTCEVYRGTLPEGAACTDSDECADIRGSDATCLYDDQGLSSGCAPETQPERGRRGDACSGTCGGDSCVGFGSPGGEGANTTCYVEDGLVCSYSQGVCVPPPVLGEPCPDYYCARGAYCAIDQLCTASKSNGESCEYDEECTGGSCVDYLCGPRTIASSELCSGQ